MRFRTRHEVREVFSFGLRFGWWPCIPGPFVQISVGRYYRSWWLDVSEARIYWRAWKEYLT